MVRPTPWSRRSAGRTSRSCFSSRNLQARQEDLQRLNQELQDTNRGVVALYAELDERADHLRRADELKSKFLSHMSHEFRTPLNSILALSRLLLGHSDGPLTAEQETQVRFIRKAAENLTELVDDLLDLANVEAGKTWWCRRRSPSHRCSVRCAACCGRCWSAMRSRWSFDDPQRRAAARHRRRQGLADPAQLHLQRDQVHRTGRGARLGDSRSRRPTR